MAHRGDVLVESALRRLLGEIETGQYVASGQPLQTDDAYLQARTVVEMFDTFREQSTARDTVQLIDVLASLVQACDRQDYRDPAGRRLRLMAAYRDAATHLQSRNTA